MWNHIRALLIAVHMAVVLIAAAPAPVGLTRKVLDQPSLQASLNMWVGLVNAVGWQLEMEAAKELAFGVGSGVLNLRNDVLRPFRPYFRHLGTGQSWRMFGYLNLRPGRLEVAIREGETWRDVFVARSSDATWRRGQLDQERLRAIVNAYSWKDRHKDYLRFSRWLSARALEDFQDASAVRVRMVPLRLPAAGPLRVSGEILLGKPYWETETTRGEP